MWRDVDRSDLPMDDGRFILDGRPLGEWPVWITSDGVDIGEATPSTSFTDVPGGTTSDLSIEDAFGAAVPPSREITIHMVTAGAYDDCRSTLSAIGALNGRRTTFEDRRLGGTWQGRCTRVTPEFKPRHGAILIDVTITAEPWLILPKHETAVTEGETTFAVHGNRPTNPKLTIIASAAAERITVDDGTRTLSITPKKPFTGGETIIIDSETGTCTTDNANTPPDLTSLYPTLTPPMTTIRIAGGRGTIEWNPHDLI